MIRADLDTDEEFKYRFVQPVERMVIDPETYPHNRHYWKVEGEDGDYSKPVYIPINHDVMGGTFKISGNNETLTVSVTTAPLDDVKLDKAHFVNLEDLTGSGFKDMTGPYTAFKVATDDTDWDGCVVAWQTNT